MVDEVKGFRAELKAPLLVYRESLKETKVPVLESRLVDQVADTLRIDCYIALSGARKQRVCRPLAKQLNSEN